MAVRSRALPDDDAAALLEHRGFVVRLCRALVRDPIDADDLAQQVFLQAYRALAKGTRPLDARAWLAQIARNECRSGARRSAAHPEAALPEGIAAIDGDTAERAAEHAFVERLQHELAALPRRQREAVVLRELRGLSYREVAAEMDETTPAVESLLQRARRRLSQRLARPLVALVLCLDTVRKAFARLLPAGGSAEVVGAGGAAAIAAKVAVVSAVAVGVGVTTGDVSGPAKAPAEVRVIHHRVQAPAESRDPASPRPVRAPVVRRSNRHREAGEPSRRRGGDGRSDSSGPGPSATQTSSPASGPSSASTSSSGSDSGSESLSSGPGPGPTLTVASTTDSSGSSGPDSGSSGSGSSGSGSSGSGSDGSSGHDGSGTSGSDD